MGVNNPPRKILFLKMEAAFTLDEILKNEPVIFSDSVICTFRRGWNWYRHLVYNRRNFLDLDWHGLNEVNAFLSEEIDWWSQPNVFSTQNVVHEIERFAHILKDKLDYLQEKECRSRKRKGGLSAEETEFRNTCCCYQWILRKSFQSIYEPKDKEVFNLLEDLIITLGEFKGLKIDFSRRYGENRNNKKSDLRADEQLVAAAIYHSVMENSSCSIVSCDSDIIRLVAGAKRYFCQREELEPVHRALGANPVHVYFLVDNDKAQMHC